MRCQIAGFGLLMLIAVVLPAYGDDGAQVYEKKCKVCHSIAGVKGAKADKGGPLDGVGAKRDEAWLRAYFADPKSQVPNAKMPKMKLSDSQWQAVTAYILTLKEPAAAH